MIVHCDQDYLNEKELSNGVKLVVNTTIESVEHINRIATVKAAPEGTVLQTGDEVIIHHNILRKRNGTAGQLVNSDFLLDEDTYYVPLDMIFAYRRSGQTWEAVAPFFFAKPIEKQEEVSKSGIIVDLGMDKYVSREATVKYLNEELREWGVEEGDVVGYDKNQEYKFEIDGELLYRVKMQKLLYKRCKD